jgi:hypothetical protein
MVNAGTDRSRAKGSTFSNALSDSINEAWNGSQSTNSAWNDAQSTNDSYSRGLTGAQGTTTQNVWNPQAGALQSIYGQAGNLAGGRGAAAQGAAGVSQTARSAWEQSLQPGGNPYFSKNVQGAIDQATQSFNRGIVPGLTEAGVGAGAYGTSRDALARGEAAGLAQQGIQNMVGGMYSDQYAADQGMRANSLGLAPQMQAMQYAPLSAAAGIVGGPTVLGQSQNTSFGNTVGGSTGQSTSGGGSYGQSTAQGGSFGRSNSSAQGGGVNSSKTDAYKFGVLSK